MDRDPQVMGIASQPFWLHWHDGIRWQRHAPDYFARLADGRGRVVDVRADDRVDDAAAESFEGLPPTALLNHPPGALCGSHSAEYEQMRWPLLGSGQPRARSPSRSVQRKHWMS